MKKIKKLMACLLCLAMLLPTTAFAGQGAAPRADIGGCPNCGRDTFYHTVHYRDVASALGQESCPFCSPGINDYLTIYDHEHSEVWDCSSCHYHSSSGFVKEYLFITCPFHGEIAIYDI